MLSHSTHVLFTHALPCRAQTRGDLEVKVVETLLDMVDGNGDGVIRYDEFSEVVMAGA